MLQGVSWAKDNIAATCRISPRSARFEHAVKFIRSIGFEVTHLYGTRSSLEGAGFHPLAGQWSEWRGSNPRNQTQTLVSRMKKLGIQRRPANEF